MSLILAQYACTIAICILSYMVRLPRIICVNGILSYLTVICFSCHNFFKSFLCHDLSVNFNPRLWKSDTSCNVWISASNLNNCMAFQIYVSLQSQHCGKQFSMFTQFMDKRFFGKNHLAERGGDEYTYLVKVWRQTLIYISPSRTSSQNWNCLRLLFNSTLFPS